MTDFELARELRRKYKLPIMKCKMLTNSYETMEAIENYIAGTKPHHFEFGVLDYKESDEIKQLRNQKMKTGYMTVEQFNDFVTRWGNSTDVERFVALKEYKNELPDFKVNIDNDAVFVTFDEQADEPITLDFEEFGYVLLTELFNFSGIKAEMV